MFDHWARCEINAARLEGYRHFGKRLDQASGSPPRRDRLRKAFELLEHERRLMFLTVAGMAVLRSTVRPPPYLPGMALHAGAAKQ